MYNLEFTMYNSELNAESRIFLILHFEFNF